MCRDISNNSLRGSVPDSWAQLQSLQRVDTGPGNAGMCSQVPANAAFKVCTQGDVLCVELPPSNQGACAEPGPSDDGSSFPVAAVVVPVAVVAVALAAGYWWYRRRKRQRAQQARKEQALKQQQQAREADKDWMGSVSAAAGLAAGA